MHLPRYCVSAVTFVTIENKFFRMSLRNLVRYKWKDIFQDWATEPPNHRTQCGRWDVLRPLLCLEFRFIRISKYGHAKKHLYALSFTFSIVDCKAIFWQLFFASKKMKTLFMEITIETKRSNVGCKRLPIGNDVVFGQGCDHWPYGSLKSVIIITIINEIVICAFDGDWYCKNEPIFQPNSFINHFSYTEKFTFVKHFCYAKNEMKKK